MASAKKGMPFGIGEYPAEYNPHVMGPYDPARYYGKADTPLSQVKLGELFGWLTRRNYSPIAMGRCVGRATWRWSKTWIQPKRASLAGYVQLLAGLGVFWYLSQRGAMKYHRHTKYHW